jgi:hypothetical protein
LNQCAGVDSAPGRWALPAPAGNAGEPQSPSCAAERPRASYWGSWIGCCAVSPGSLWERTSLVAALPWVGGVWHWGSAASVRSSSVQRAHLLTYFFNRGQGPYRQQQDHCRRTCSILATEQRAAAVRSIRALRRWRLRRGPRRGAPLRSQRTGAERRVTRGCGAQPSAMVHPAPARGARAGATSRARPASLLRRDRYSRWSICQRGPPGKRPGAPRRIAAHPSVSAPISPLSQGRDVRPQGEDVARPHLRRPHRQAAPRRQARRAPPTRPFSLPTLGKP